MKLRLGDVLATVVKVGPERVPNTGVQVNALTATAFEYESTADDLVGLLRGVIAARRDPCYGALKISDDQLRELANAIAGNVLACYDVRPL